MVKSLEILLKLRTLSRTRYRHLNSVLFAGFISKSGPNVVRRFMTSVGYILPGFVSAFLVMNWAKNENHRLSRKDPKEFENDQ